MAKHEQKIDPLLFSPQRLADQQGVMTVKHGTRPTILVVDDEQSIVSLLTSLLEESGYQVLSAFNGRQALEMARQYKPDLIITDLMMPLMDGAALIAALHQDPQLSQVVTILMSAASRARLQDVEADVVVDKPFDIDLLDDILSHFLSVTK